MTDRSGTRPELTFERWRERLRDTQAPVAEIIGLLRASTKVRVEQPMSSGDKRVMVVRVLMEFVNDSDSNIASAAHIELAREHLDRLPFEGDGVSQSQWLNVGNTKVQLCQQIVEYLMFMPGMYNLPGNDQDRRRVHAFLSRLHYAEQWTRADRIPICDIEKAMVSTRAWYYLNGHAVVSAVPALFSQVKRRGQDKEFRLQAADVWVRLPSLGSEAGTYHLWPEHEEFFEGLYNKPGDTMILRGDVLTVMRLCGRTWGALSHDVQTLLQLTSRGLALYEQIMKPGGLANLPRAMTYNQR